MVITRISGTWHDLEKDHGNLFNILEEDIRGAYPILIIPNTEDNPLKNIAEDMEQEALVALVVNKLRWSLKIVAIKAPCFAERKTQHFDDICIVVLLGVRQTSNWNLFMITSTSYEHSCFCNNYNQI